MKQNIYEIENGADINNFGFSILVGQVVALARSPHKWLDTLGGNEKTNRRNNALAPKLQQLLHRDLYCDNKKPRLRRMLQFHSRYRNTNESFGERGLMLKPNHIQLDTCILMSIFHLIYTNFFVPCSLQFNCAYHFKLALSVPRLQHDVVTCNGLTWSKKPSLVSLHECRPILRKLTSVHLEFDHHLVPRLTDKLKQRKWATQPIKYITICTEISCSFMRE